MKIHLGDKLKTEGEETRVKLWTSMFAAFDSFSADFFLPLGWFVFPDNEDIHTEKMSGKSRNVTRSPESVNLYNPSHVLC